MKDEKFYKTSDLALASYLSMNFPVRDLITEGVRGYFLFEPSEKLTEAIDKFFNDTAWVQPFAYYNAIKTLKNRVYDMKERQSESL